MSGWRRVSEGGCLEFLRRAVEDREAAVSADAYRTPTSVFDAVPPVLVNDGRAYFPDPTLHTGFTVLSHEARVYLDAVVRRENDHKRATRQHTLLFATAFVALTLAGVAGAWAASVM
jgi:hypothetical protein